MEKLWDKHEWDLEELAIKVLNSNANKIRNNGPSKDLLNMKWQIDVLVSVHKYEEADKVKQMVMMQETMEWETIDKANNDIIMKEQWKLKSAQVKQMKAMLKWI